MLVFDERHQVHVVVTPDDEDPLARVTIGVRMFQDVEQTAALDVEDDVLEPNAPSRLEFRVPCVVPGKVFSLPGKQHDVCL